MANNMSDIAETETRWKVKADARWSYPSRQPILVGIYTDGYQFYGTNVKLYTGENDWNSEILNLEERTVDSAVHRVDVRIGAIAGKPRVGGKIELGDHLFLTRQYGEDVGSTLGPDCRIVEIREFQIPKAKKELVEEEGTLDETISFSSDDDHCPHCM